MPLPDRENLVEELFACIDAQDADRFAGFLAPDATFRFGSAPVVSGRDAIRDAVGAFFDSIAALEHAVERIMNDGETLVCLGEVTYTRDDGRRVTVPFADALGVRDGAIHDYRIYIDISPLHAS